MKTLLDLQMNECRWPLDDTLSAPRTFCAAPKAGGGSHYCAWHHAMAYVPVPDARRRATERLCVVSADKAAACTEAALVAGGSAFDYADALRLRDVSGVPSELATAAGEVVE